MKELPKNVASYKQTPVFKEDTIPAGLLQAHKTKAGTWGKIVIIKGQLLYRILEPIKEQIRLAPDFDGVIAPSMLHEVEPMGEVEFYVEFYRHRID